MKYTRLANNVILKRGDIVMVTPSSAKLHKDIANFYCDI